MQKIKVLGILIVVISMLGCLEEFKSNIQGESNNSDDMIYMSYLREIVDVIKTDLDEVIEATTDVSKNQIDIEKKGRKLKEDSQKYLDKFNKLTVSSSYKPSYDEYKRALEKYRIAGENIEYGSTESIQLGLQYMVEGSKHITAGNNVWPGKEKIVTTPIPTQTVATPYSIPTEQYSTIQSEQTNKQEPVIIVKTTTELSSAFVSIYGKVKTSPPGKIFAIVTLEIHNSGYESFSVSPLNWAMVIDDYRYGYALDTYNIENHIVSETIYDGDTVKGKLIFEIPSDSDSTNYIFKYILSSDEYNIRYE